MFGEKETPRESSEPPQVTFSAGWHCLRINWKDWLVPDSLVPGNPYIIWISIALNSKYMEHF
jgi:hypothetical protein